MNHLSEDVRVLKVKDASVAGQTAINSDAVDVSGYEGCMFVVNAEAITAGGAQSIKVQQDAASNMASAADLAGTSVTIADDDDNQLFYVDVKRPRERYLRLVVSRATQNSAFGPIYAILYGPRKKPVANNVTDTMTGEKYEGPAEGTA